LERRESIGYIASRGEFRSPFSFMVALFVATRFLPGNDESRPRLTATGNRKPAQQIPLDVDKVPVSRDLPNTTF